MYWKFVCTPETEGECFLRRLFGDTESYKKEKPVKKGEILFLHNIGTKAYPLDILYGPFTAETDAGLIEPDAWNGKFRWQVRVSWNRIFKLTNASQVIPYLTEKYRFSDSEGEKILKTLEEKGLEIIAHSPEPVLPENISE